MLPFKKNEASVNVPNDTIRRTPDTEQEYDPLESAAEDLFHSIKTGDYKGIASAIRAAFDLCDSEPHVEGPHINEGEK